MVDLELIRPPLRYRLFVVAPRKESKEHTFTDKQRHLCEGEEEEEEERGGERRRVNLY